jgi:hypothetical protein
MTSIIQETSTILSLPDLSILRRRRRRQIRWAKFEYFRSVRDAVLFNKRHVQGRFYKDMFRNCKPFFYLFTYPARTDLRPFREVAALYGLKARIVVRLSAEVIFNFSMAQRLFIGYTMVVFGSDRDEFIKSGQSRVWETDIELVGGAGFTLLMAGLDNHHLMAPDWETYSESEYMSGVPAIEIATLLSTPAANFSLSFPKQWVVPQFFRAISHGFMYINNP